MYVDTHSHIYHQDFDNDRDMMLARARDSGVTRIFMPCIDSSSIGDMIGLEHEYPNECFAMMGLHPCSVKADFMEELAIVEDWLGKRQFAAVGEIGIDLYWDKTFWEQQKEAFVIQVDWAKKYQLPIVIHCRESMDETIALLEPLADGKLKGIFHCFTGSFAQAKRIVDIGFLLGIGGVVTFKNGGLDHVLPHIDLGHIVLETDSPYLAPAPNRGKRNEPSYIPLIASRIASLKHCTIEEVGKTTTKNANRLFGR